MKEGGNDLERKSWRKWLVDQFWKSRVYQGVNDLEVVEVIFPIATTTPRPGDASATAIPPIA